MVRLLVLISLVLLTIPLVANAQLTRWCPAGDGDVVFGVGVGNRTVDVNSDGVVNLIDVAWFAMWWAPNPYNVCADYDNNGVVALVDLAFFGAHYRHFGPVIGLCN